MASPFDIEEIYPDEGPAPRLPRRQAGTSPRSVAVALLTDDTLRTRAALPSAAIGTQRRAPRGQRALVDAGHVDAISGHYEAFLRRWTPLVSRLATVDGAAAVRARTEVMDTAVYDGLAEAAETHVRAHTTADMLAGVREDGPCA
ncbi:hypothetical protein [Micromonospora sp. CNB394]|uniref:hypothetical protein n=1 Tax=Micromonospora sp. CNB394 TaxID=1169151 RepID=UPI00036005A1|nr:hypothetical protein [Micromonospora sp. CNB394]